VGYLVSEEYEIQLVPLFHTHLDGMAATLETTERNVVLPADQVAARERDCPDKKNERRESMRVPYDTMGDRRMGSHSPSSA
jgi:hypothetical protein